MTTKAPRIFEGDNDLDSGSISLRSKFRDMIPFFKELSRQAPTANRRTILDTFADRFGSRPVKYLAERDFADRDANNIPESFPDYYLLLRRHKIPFNIYIDPFAIFNASQVFATIEGNSVVNDMLTKIATPQSAVNMADTLCTYFVGGDKPTKMQILEYWARSHRYAFPNSHRNVQRIFEPNITGDIATGLQVIATKTLRGSLLSPDDNDIKDKYLAVIFPTGLIWYFPNVSYSVISDVAQVAANGINYCMGYKTNRSKFIFMDLCPRPDPTQVDQQQWDVADVVQDAVMTHLLSYCLGAFTTGPISDIVKRVR